MDPWRPEPYLHLCRLSATITEACYAPRRAVPKADYCVTLAPDARRTATLNGVIVNGLARPRAPDTYRPGLHKGRSDITCFRRRGRKPGRRRCFRAAIHLCLSASQSRAVAGAPEAATGSKYMIRVWSLVGLATEPPI